jgi:hypothetical protein
VGRRPSLRPDCSTRLRNYTLPRRWSNGSCKDEFIDAPFLQMIVILELLACEVS